jgi:hypothetical protein
MLISNLHATPVYPDQGVSFRQVDLTFDGAEQPDSRYGMVVVDIPTLVGNTGIAEGYINIALDDGTWDVRNLLISIESGYPGINTIFDLGGTGDVSVLEAHVDFSEDPTDSFSAVPDAVFEVLPVEYNAQGFDTQVTAPPNDPPGVAGLVFNPVGNIRRIWQGLAANVEQDLNQCAPASVANSLQWLEDTNPFIFVPHPHVPGIRDLSLVGQLDIEMGRPPHVGLMPFNALVGKLMYIDKNGLGPMLRCKHKNSPGGAMHLPNAVVRPRFVASWPNLNMGLDLIDWVIREVKRGEDVELGIGWPGGGGHFVRVCAGGYILGVPWIAFVHDAKQGFLDPNGTPGNPFDDVTDINGGVNWWDGGLSFAFVPNDVFVGFIGRGSAEFAFTESPRMHYINKTIHKGKGPDAWDVRIRRRGDHQIIDHYDGNPADYHFAEFNWWREQDYTMLRWWDSRLPGGKPGGIPFCTYIHIGYSAMSPDGPGEIVEIVWTDENGDPIPGGEIRQVRSEHVPPPKGYPGFPGLVLGYDQPDGFAEITQVYASVVDDAFLLEELNDDNPAFDPGNMTLVAEGPIVLAPGEETPPLEIPIMADLGQVVIYRMTGGGDNDFIDFGQHALDERQPAAIEDRVLPPARMVTLQPAQPNPFRETTTIAFSILISGRTTLKIYDVEGTLVRTLVDEWIDAEETGRVVTWDGTNSSGQRVANGEYFLKLRCGTFEDARRLVYIR